MKLPPPALLAALPLAAAALATPAAARDWAPVTAAQNALALEMTGRPGPFATPAPDAVPAMIGTIAAADLIARGCTRVPGEPAAETIRAAVDELRTEIEGRRLNMAVSVAQNGGTFPVRLIAQLLRGCPATAPATPVTPAPGTPAPTFDRATALQLLAQLRAMIEGAK